MRIQNVALNSRAYAAQIKVGKKYNNNKEIDMKSVNDEECDLWGA